MTAAGSVPGRGVVWASGRALQRGHRVLSKRLFGPILGEERRGGRRQHDPVGRLRKEELPAGDFLREAVHWFVHALLEAEVTALVGAAPFERTEERTAQRNGHRSRRWDTRVGTLE